MGLDIKVKEKNMFSCGYIGFTHFMNTVVKAFDEELGDFNERIVKRQLMHQHDKFVSDMLSRRYDKRVKELKCEDLNIWIYHSDCDGIITPEDSKKIFKHFENIEFTDEFLEIETNSKERQKAYKEWLEQWKEIFRESIKQNANVEFY